MSNVKTFTGAGVSRQHGVLKLRLVNDLAWRQFMLTKEGHVDIKLVDFAGGVEGVEFSKTQLVQMLAVHADFQDAETQAVITDYLTKVGVIEKPKAKRGRPAKVVAEAAPAADAVEGADAAGAAEAPAGEAELPEVSDALADAAVEAVAEPEAAVTETAGEAA